MQTKYKKGDVVYIEAMNFDMETTRLIGTLSEDYELAPGMPPINQAIDADNPYLGYFDIEHFRIRRKQMRLATPKEKKYIIMGYLDKAQRPQKISNPTGYSQHTRSTSEAILANKQELLKKEQEDKKKRHKRPRIISIPMGGQNQK